MVEGCFSIECPGFHAGSNVKALNDKTYRSVWILEPVKDNCNLQQIAHFWDFKLQYYFSNRGLPSYSEYL